MGNRRLGYSGTFRGPIAVFRVALCMIFASGGRETLWRNLIVRVTLSHLCFPFGAGPGSSVFVDSEDSLAARPVCSGDSPDGW